MNKVKSPNDDLFEGTKMTFGEHLEELRCTLFRAVFGMAIGIGIGFWAADYVVDLIKLPLSKALTRHQVDKTIRDLERNYPAGIPTAIKTFIRQREVVFDSVYLETDELRRIAKSLDEQAQSSESAASQPVTDTPAGNGGTAAGTAHAESVTTKEGASTKKSADEEVADIFGDTVPAPTARLVHSRMWRPISMQVTALSAQEAFMIWMKAAFVAGIVFSSPWVFVQIWNFIAAGLYPHEKNYVFIYLPMSLGLFLAGAALAFFFVFDPVLRFLFSFNESLGIGLDARISEWLSFVLFMPLGFGISFQLPLVMLFLNRIGIVSLKVFVEKWRIAVLVIVVASSVLTPADPISLLLMAVPLTILYFFGLALCRWMPSQRSPFSEVYEP